MPFRLTLTRIIAAAIPLGAAPLHAQASARHSDVSPDVAPAPSGVAHILAKDSTVASRAFTQADADSRDHATDCAPGLRDPRSGATYLLVESQSRRVTSPVKRGESVTTSRSVGNYDLVDAGKRAAPRIPPKHFLRVACGSNEVLGIGRTLSPSP